MIVLHDARNGVVGKSVSCGEGLDVRLAVLVACLAVHAVAVAAHPDLSVASLTERQNLVDDAAFRTVELVRLMLCGEETLAISTRFQIDANHSAYAAHHECAVAGDQRTYTTLYVAASGERIFQTLLAQIIEEQTLVGTYPHTFINAVVSQYTYEGKQRLVFAAHVQTLYIVGLLGVSYCHAASPRANP